jgi:hypothetical protein
MKNISSVADLKDAISELEFNKAVHRRMLKDSFNDTVDSLKPGKIFRNLTHAIKNPSLLSNILPAALGMSAGLVSEIVSSKIAHGGTRRNRFRRILTSLALYGVATVFVKNPEISRVFGRRVLNSVFSK